MGFDFFGFEFGFFAAELGLDFVFHEVYGFVEVVGAGFCVEVVAGDADVDFDVVGPGAVVFVVEEHDVCAEGVAFVDPVEGGDFGFDVFADGWCEFDVPDGVVNFHKARILIGCEKLFQRCLSVVHDGACVFAQDGAAQAVFDEGIEDGNGYVVVHAEGEGSAVHDFDAVAQGIVVVEAQEFFGGGVFLGVAFIDAVDFGGLEEDMGFDLCSAQGRSGIGGEVGVAGAGHEDDDVAAFEVGDGAATDEGFGDVAHVNRSHDAGFDALAFECVLKGEAINDCGEHAHVVGLGAVHTDFGRITSAPDVAAADDDSDGCAGVAGEFDLGGHVAHDARADGFAGALEGFSAEFDQDAVRFTWAALV